MRLILSRVETIARSDTSVLLVGGTGPETTWKDGQLWPNRNRRAFTATGTTRWGHSEVGEPHERDSYFLATP